METSPSREYHGHPAKPSQVPKGLCVGDMSPVMPPKEWVRSLSFRSTVVTPIPPTGVLPSAVRTTMFFTVVLLFEFECATTLRLARVLVTVLGAPRFLPAATSLSAGMVNTKSVCRLLEHPTAALTAGVVDAKVRITVIFFVPAFNASVSITEFCFAGFLCTAIACGTTMYLTIRMLLQFQFVAAFLGAVMVAAKRMLFRLLAATVVLLTCMVIAELKFGASLFVTTLLLTERQRFENQCYAAPLAEDAFVDVDVGNG
eukprot:TRINITY_DN68175_c5_g1_i3.p2 TRINITY_DN68175_c5_g1~~TRINITY_DN68175_c5_g1_i3.p2  ORF type:complete len:258 (-),score=-3.53 TRINITY_DN68175_c5_g1_i3:527-1300(-)